MLVSYQSEMRLLLLRGDSEHSLGRVDNEMKLNWTSDPDFSVTLGILQSGGEKLSNYMMQCIVDNDANVHLLEDKLLSLLPRCDEMNLETLLMVVIRARRRSVRRFFGFFQEEQSCTLSFIQVNRRDEEETY